MLGPDEDRLLSRDGLAALQGRLRAHMRENTYDPETGTIRLDADRATAISTRRVSRRRCGHLPKVKRPRFLNE